jgi:hypothetical protein
LVAAFYLFLFSVFLCLLFQVSFRLFGRVKYELIRIEMIKGDQRVVSQRNSNVFVSTEPLLTANLTATVFNLKLISKTIKVMPHVVDNVLFAYYGEESSFLDRNIPGYLLRQSEINIPSDVAKDITYSTIELAKRLNVSTSKSRFPF